MLLSWLDSRRRLVHKIVEDVYPIRLGSPNKGYR